MQYFDGNGCWGDDCCVGVVVLLVVVIVVVVMLMVVVWKLIFMLVVAVVMMVVVVQCPPGRNLWQPPPSLSQFLARPRLVESSTHFLFLSLRHLRSRPSFPLYSIPLYVVFNQALRWQCTCVGYVVS